MNKELKERWITALQSGNYEQAKGYLCVGNRLCCIGVLCDIVDSNKWSTCFGRAENYDFDDEGTDYEFPPPGWLKTVGLDYHLAQKLAVLNDHEGKSFAEIAEVIKERVQVDNEND
jgi:hypothetical protein